VPWTHPTTTRPIFFLSINSNRKRERERSCGVFLWGGWVLFTYLPNLNVVVCLAITFLLSCTIHLHYLPLHVTPQPIHIICTKVCQHFPHPLHSFMKIQIHFNGITNFFVIMCIYYISKWNQMNWNTSNYSNPIVFQSMGFFFFFQFWCSWLRWGSFISQLSQIWLLRKYERKKKKKTSFYIIDYLLEPCIEMWRFLKDFLSYFLQIFVICFWKKSLTLWHKNFQNFTTEWNFPPKKGWLWYPRNSCAKDILKFEGGCVCRFRFGISM